MPKRIRAGLRANRTRGLVTTISVIDQKSGLQMSQPLESVRVLTVEQYGAGPFGTQFLADLGAEVIKVENPNDGGDFARGIGPYFFTATDSQFFHSYNRNKKSLGPDLSKEEGMGVFRDLCREADAVASNLRGDVPAK